MVGKNDLITGARQDDAVVRATFPVDIHAISAERNKTAAYTSAGIKAKPYDIPLRSLLAALPRARTVDDYEALLPWRLAR